MEPEGSQYSNVVSRNFCVAFLNGINFYCEGLLGLTNLQAGGPPFLSCPGLLIQYIFSYAPCLGTVSSIN